MASFCGHEPSRREIIIGSVVFFLLVGVAAYFGSVWDLKEQCADQCSPYLPQLMHNKCYCDHTVQKP